MDLGCNQRCARLFHSRVLESPRSIDSSRESCALPRKFHCWDMDWTNRTHPLVEHPPMFYCIDPHSNHLHIRRDRHRCPKKDRSSLLSTENLLADLSHLRRGGVGHETRTSIFAWIGQTEDKLRTIAQSNGMCICSCTARMNIGTGRTKSSNASQLIDVELSIFDLREILNHFRRCILTEITPNHFWAIALSTVG